MRNSLKEYLGKNIKSMLSLISPTLNSKVLYWCYFKKKLNLKNPKTLNEKLNWLKLNTYNNNALVTKCADKYAVREYIKFCGCEEILNELYGIYNTAEEIEWNKFPNKFVLKWNFGRGYNLICTDKTKLDFNEVKNTMRKWGKEKSHLHLSVMLYKNIDKKIICEKYIEGSNGQLPDDYKIYCFNGKPLYVMVCVDRDKCSQKFYFFDRDWNIKCLNLDSKNAKTEELPLKPLQIDNMFEYAELLAKPFPFVRADFYINNETVIFGELTFVPSGGFDKNRLQETDIIFGNLVDFSYNI